MQTGTISQTLAARQDMPNFATKRLFRCLNADFQAQIRPLSDIKQTKIKQKSNKNQDFANHWQGIFPLLQMQFPLKMAGLRQCSRYMGDLPFVTRLTETLSAQLLAQELRPCDTH